MDTNRPVAGPASRAYGDADQSAHLPSLRWVAFLVFVGTLIVVLPIGYSHTQEHPETLEALGIRKPEAPQPKPPTAVKTPASPASASSAPASSPPPAKAPSTASAAGELDGGAVATNQSGFLQIPGPPGARVFDGDKSIGTAPLKLAASVGAHVIRVEPVGTGKVRSFNVEVRAAETTLVARAPRSHRRPRPPKSQ